MSEPFISTSPMITGHRGFLGRALFHEFKKMFYRDNATHGPYAGWRYEGYDYPNHTIIWPDPYAPKGRAVTKFDLDEQIAASDSVIHCAAVANLHDVEADPGKAARINLEGTMNIAAMCARHNVPLVFISTCCVYGRAGNGGTILNEGVTPDPTEPYAQGKLLMEHWLAGYAKAAGLRYRVARIGTLYGPGMRPALFNWIAFEKAFRKEAVTVNHPGTQTRTYLYIDDAAEGIRAVLEYGKDGETYNLAGPDSPSVYDTVRMTQAMTGNAVGFRVAPMRPGEILEENISCVKAATELGWAAKVGYAEGMKRLMTWHASPEGVAVSAAVRVAEQQREATT